MSDFFSKCMRVIVCVCPQMCTQTHRGPGLVLWSIMMVAGVDHARVARLVSTCLDLLSHLEGPCLPACFPFCLSLLPSFFFLFKQS